MRRANWAEVFDEAYLEAGASPELLAEFARSVAGPLTPAEVEIVNQSQRNPFPPGDPLHAAYRRFDPARWVIPTTPLPASYLAFLAWSNGGELRTGARWFQFFPALDPEHGPRAMLLAYDLPEYMPGALPFAFNGGGTFYLFDMRQAAADGEYPIVCAHSGSLGWAADMHLRIASTFEEACRGTEDVDELRALGS